MITLKRDDIEVVVDPENGARVTSFRFQGVHIFYPPVDGGRGGCFPLVPWSNRIRDGVLDMGGKELKLPATEDGARHAIHGHGRWVSWKQQDGEESYAHLVYEHKAGDYRWPFSYRAVQAVSVEGGALFIGLSLTNTDDKPMPAGLGLHPYFPASRKTDLTFRAKSHWPPLQAGKFPQEAKAISWNLDRSKGGPLPPGLDEGFGEWERKARVAWGGGEPMVQMEASPGLNHLIVYTPTDRDYFCAEPVSHVIDGHNLQRRGVLGTGARELQPGEEWNEGVVFNVAVK